MILIIGPTFDPVLVYFSRFLKQNRIPFLFLDQKEIFHRWIFKGDDKSGWKLVLDRQHYSLSDFTGIYVRLADVRLDYSNAFRNAQQWLQHFLDIVPLPVVNRPQSASSNFSKCYQLQMIEKFLPVPSSLISNNLSAISKFRQTHGNCIFKSVSSERSIVQPLDSFLELRGEYLEASPILLQPQFKGPNVRVHVVGNQIFALLIQSEVLDYRYSEKFGKRCWTQAVQLSSDLQKRCIRLTKALGLSFSGIDLIYNGPKDVYCLEVNTSPAYTHFENSEFRSISKALAHYLLGNKDLNDNHHHNQRLAISQQKEGL